MAMDTRAFTFKSLTGNAEFEMETATTGTNQAMVDFMHGGGRRGGAGLITNRMLTWVLIPCCCLGFLLFAVLGTASVVVTIEDGNYAANLVGGKELPRPPPPPPREPIALRSPSPPFEFPPPPSPHPPWLGFQILHAEPLAPPPSPMPPNPSVRA